MLRPEPRLRENVSNVGTAAAHTVVKQVAATKYYRDIALELVLKGRVQLRHAHTCL